MNCSNCVAKGRESICEACKRMRAESRWIWEIDTGNRHVRCPECNHALSISLWCYELPYRYCAWCGKQMVNGEQLKMEIE